MKTTSLFDNQPQSLLHAYLIYLIYSFIHACLYEWMANYIIFIDSHLKS